MTAAIKNVHPIRWIQMENRRFREFIAEFIGTFFFVFIGVSANIQAAMQPNPVSLLTAQFAWGFGLMFGIYLAINVSGGHLNPAISFSALMFGKIGILQFIIYTIAQLLGAFAGTGIAFVGHLDDMGQLTQHWTRRETIGPNATAGLFATFPTTHMTVLGSIADELLGTAILAGMIAVCTDKRREIHQSHVPLLIGLTLITIAMTFGLNGGFAVNPARDFGPRLFLLCVGYGWRLFSVHKYFFLIPLIVPFFGAPLGTAIYELFVGIHGWNEQIDVVNEQYPQREHKVINTHQTGANSSEGAAAAVVAIEISSASTDNTNVSPFADGDHNHTLAAAAAADGDEFANIGEAIKTATTVATAVAAPGTGSPA